MDKSQQLALKNPLTVYEAAQLLPWSNVGSKAAVSFIVDAINLKELAAAIKRWPKYDAGVAAHSSDGDINQMETTVQRSDLDAWLKTKGLAVAVQVFANPGIALMTHAERKSTVTAQRKSQADDTMTSDTTAHRQNVWAAALGQVESARINCHAEIGEKTTHRLTDTSTRVLAEVIAHARKCAVDASDYQSVWTALVTLAVSGNSPPPLLAQFERGESIKYDAGNRVKIFTKSALRGMMTRAVTKRAK